MFLADLLQLRYTVAETGFQLMYPPVFTTCVQQLSNGSCMFPSAEGQEWLCARMKK